MEIPLKNRKGKIVDYALVSEEDYLNLSQYKWSKGRQNYISGSINGKSWRLHRYIMINILGNEITPQNPVDHINRNPLDNRRENLRIVTVSENNRNRKRRENRTSEYQWGL